MNEMSDGFGTKEKKAWHHPLRKAKERKSAVQQNDKIVLIIVGISIKTWIWLMTQTPVLVLLNSIHFPHLHPQKGIPWHKLKQVGPLKLFFSYCCHYSPILMSLKYHNIKNKCNPFTKQWAINNNQVVFLYCIYVHTQRVKFVVYMYTKQLAV